MFGWKAARAVFRLEMKTLMSLKTAYGLLQDIISHYSYARIQLKMRQNCEAISAQADVDYWFEAFKWLIEELIQMHVAFKLPYFARAFGYVAFGEDNCAGGAANQRQEGREDLFNYLLSLRHETRVIVRLHINMVHLALDWGLWELAHAVLQSNLMTLDGKLPALNHLSFIIAIESDYLDAAAWVFDQIGPLKAHQALMNYKKGCIKSVAMFEWLKLVIQADINLYPLINVDRLFAKGNPKDCFLVVELLQHGLQYGHMLDHEQKLMSYFAKVDISSLKPIWCTSIMPKLNAETDYYAKKRSERLHLVYAALTEDVESLGMVLQQKSYSDDVGLVFCLAAQRGNLRIFKLISEAVFGMDFSDWSSKKTFTDVLVQMCVEACRGGHLDVLQYIFHVDASLWSFSCVKRLAELAVEHNQPKVLEMCLLKYYVTQGDRLKKLLPKALQNNSIECIELLVRYCFRTLRQNPNDSSAQLVEYLNGSIRSIKEPVLKWLWFNGFDHVIQKMDLDRLISREKIGMIRFLMNVLGRPLVDQYLCQSSTTWYSTDMVHYMVTTLNVKFVKASNLCNCTISNLGFCAHVVDSEYIQWLVSHNLWQLVDLESLRDNRNKCLKNNDGAGCYLSLLWDLLPDDVQQLD